MERLGVLCDENTGRVSLADGTGQPFCCSISRDFALRFRQAPGFALSGLFRQWWWIAFDQTNRALDVMTPMAGAKQAVSQLVVPTRSLCRSADPVADIVWYPCMDMKFASFVRDTVDALCHLTVPVCALWSVPAVALHPRHGSNLCIFCYRNQESGVVIG